MSVPKRQHIFVDDESVAQLIGNLDSIDQVLTPHMHNDAECCQIVLESRWLSNTLKSGRLILPNWRLALSSQLQQRLEYKYPQVAELILKVAAQIIEIRLIAESGELSDFEKQPQNLAS